MAQGDAGAQEVALLDGKKVSALVLAELQARLKEEGLCPHLHVVTVGEDVGSQVYVKQKKLAAERTGLLFSQTSLPAETSLEELRKAIDAKNRDKGVHGLIVQLPLPESLRGHEREVLDMVDPEKDVDCFHPVNFGHLALGRPIFQPATPAGIMRLLKHYGVETKGKHCVVLGKSDIVGKPLALLLAQEDGPAATVTLCDRHTEGLWDITRSADILVVAAGRHHLVSDPSVVKEGAAIVDVGIHRVPGPDGKSRVQGDVDAAAVSSRCRWLSPVPGGVGPMTVACLLEQVATAASRLAAPRAQVLKAFKENAPGQLSKGDFAAVLARLDPAFPAERCERALATIEGEGGTVTVEDFLAWVFDDGGMVCRAAPS